MSEYVVRAVAEGEERATRDVLGRALHRPPVSDEHWARIAPAWTAEGKFAAFDGDEPIGVTSSFTTEMLVPGGRRLPFAAVDGVGVRADWTRRGVLTELMAAQLTDFVGRGQVLAGLHASEATIYGRYGYGAAARGQIFAIDRAKVRWRADAPRPGRVRLLGDADALTIVPALFRSIGSLRPGNIARPDHWWLNDHDTRVLDGHRVAVHYGRDGADGFATFVTATERAPVLAEWRTTMQVRELHAANPAALAGLWRFLLSVDLVQTAYANVRPMDDTLPAMLEDPRACRTTAIEDELWLRLLDVPAALDARAYGQAEPVVIEVADRHLIANSGAYRVTPDGASRTDAPADVRLDIETLGMLYLGGWRPSLLARAGRIEVFDAEAPARLDALFQTAAEPWCGTHF
ncbi:Predicted acetyltransferase [Amycolatopsis xylanica]|uniref:Predicted acetyltransferase n=1 Tax=Amycolatopsis xylanica TaxID=589385 RepID=A0A1H3K387_9PSEU|nr:GNAT family N-acetyltransferase [Amycolatopsis xylanica]SDY46667.1 Predicted acetyltransferase [Amycolatopsis xylanica]